jgi:hypothetical protein
MVSPTRPETPVLQKNSIEALLKKLKKAGKMGFF